MFEIIYPEHRFVSEDQIKMWYFDAVANGEVDEEGLTNPEDMAKELNHIGHITLTTRRG